MVAFDEHRWRLLSLPQFLGCLLVLGAGTMITATLAHAQQDASGSSPTALDGGTLADLSIRKQGPSSCTDEHLCSTDLLITNEGKAIFRGPLFIEDNAPDGFQLVEFQPNTQWICVQTAQFIECADPEFTLEPGKSQEIKVVTQKPILEVPEAAASVENCARFRWPLADSSTPESVATSVQLALTLYGYNTGEVDGLVGENTTKAVSDYQKDHGLEVTGQIDLNLINALFGNSDSSRGDANPANDRSCLQQELPGGDISTGGHTRESTHQRYASPVHTRLETHYRSSSYRHERGLSHFRFGSYHSPYMSHDPAYSGHSNYWSHYRVGSGHSNWVSHYRYGSRHGAGDSHRKHGSVHGLRDSHYKYGSGHSGPDSHRKYGSVHSASESHWKSGSSHSGASSHRRLSSTHSSLESHRRQGSTHSLSESHRRQGSTHSSSESHRRQGSTHSSSESHRRQGSTHSSSKSHRRQGSTHSSSQSHRKVGSSGGGGGGGSAAQRCHKAGGTWMHVKDKSRWVCKVY